MLENWENHEPTHLQEAKDWLQEQYELAEAAGVSAEFEAFVQQALGDAKLKLMSDGLEAIADALGIEPEEVR